MCSGVESVGWESVSLYLCIIYGICFCFVGFEFWTVRIFFKFNIPLCSGSDDKDVYTI